MALPLPALAAANGAGGSTPSMHDDTPATAAQAAQDEKARGDAPGGNAPEGIPMDSDEDPDLSATPTPSRLTTPPFEQPASATKNTGGDAAEARHDYLSGTEHH